MTVVWDWCGGLPSCLWKVAPPCDLGMAQVILFPQPFLFVFLVDKTLVLLALAWLLALDRLRLH